MILCLMLRYGFPNLTPHAYVDPRLLDFQSISHSPHYLDLRLQKSNKFYENWIS